MIKITIGWIRNDLVRKNLKIFVTKEDNSNIRAGYNTNYRVIETVPMGTPLAKKESHKNWLRVYLQNGGIGWINENLVTELGGIEEWFFSGVLLTR